MYVINALNTYTTSGRPFVKFFKLMEMGGLSLAAAP